MSVPASAEPAPPASGDDLSEVIPDIIVTAQRREEAISTEPISVQAISGAQLSKFGASDTLALTQLSPSLSFTQSASSNNSGFTMRGVSSAALTGSVQPSVAMIVDGVPVYRTGEFISDLNDIERIEVLRGPQGTLFGKNSTAGLINVIQQAPVREFKASLEAGATTDTEYLVRGMLNVPVSDVLGLRISAVHRDQAPLVRNLGPAGDVAGDKVDAVSAKLLFKPGLDFKLLLSGSYSDRRSSYNQFITSLPSPSLASLQEQITGLPYGPENHTVSTDMPAKDLSKTSGLNAEASWYVDDSVTLTSLTGYHHVATDDELDSDNTPLGYTKGRGPTSDPRTALLPLLSVDPGLPREPEKINYWSQELRFNYDSDRTSVVAGLYYQDAVVRGSSRTPLVLNFSVPPFYSDDPHAYHYTDRTSAVFGDITRKFIDTVSAFAGLRYTHESLDLDYHHDSYFTTVGAGYDPLTDQVTAPPVLSVDFSQRHAENRLSGRGGFKWEPGTGQNYYVSYNLGYKGPALDTSSAAVAGQAVLKPEIAKGYEIGTKQRMLDGRLAASLSLYYLRIDGIQVASVIEGTTSTRLINAGALNSKGAEGELQFAVTKALRLDGGFAYTAAHYAGDIRYSCNYPQTSGALGGCITTDPKYPGGYQQLDGKDAVNSPKWRFNVDGRYELRDLIPGTLSLDVAYIWTSQLQPALNQDPGLVIPRHGMLNASVTATSENGRWQATLYGRNLTNEFYYSFNTEVAGFIGRQLSTVSRDFQRYGGITVTYRF